MNRRASVRRVPGPRTTYDAQAVGDGTAFAHICMQEYLHMRGDRQAGRQADRHVCTLCHAGMILHRSPKLRDATVVCGQISGGISGHDHDGRQHCQLVSSRGVGSRLDNQGGGPLPPTTLPRTRRERRPWALRLREDVQDTTSCVAQKSEQSPPVAYVRYIRGRPRLGIVVVSVGSQSVSRTAATT